MKIESEILENYKAYKEFKQELQSKQESTELANANQRDEFLKNYYSIKEKRELTEREHGKLLDEAKNYYFGNALKGIYIGALEAATLTDDALFLAENMVDTYIKENGGYNAIMNNAAVDTYALAKIRRVVEDAAEEDVENLEKEDQDIDDIEDIELQKDPEDEANSAEVASDTQLTTANITDIVAALNKSGLEIVKKGEEADNFKESEPEAEDNEVEATMEAEPEDSAGAENKDEEIKDNLDSAAEDLKDEESITAPEGSSEEATGDLPSTTTAEPAPKEEESKEEEDSDDEDDDELDKDLEEADKNDEAKEDTDSLDPDTVEVNDDNEDEAEDDGGIELDSEEEGDEDLDDLDDEELDDDEEESEEEEDAEDIDIDGDGDPDVGDIEEPEPTVNTDPNATMMDELEKEPEIQKAVELIRTRVADAEEAFMKRNQEDKKQIDELLSKISQNVAAVEKISGEDKDKEAELEESVMLYKQKVKDIGSNNVTVFDKLTRNISESIINDKTKINMFLNESGTPDFGLITETSKVMYAFLETLNTLQLERIDGAYISKVLGINK